MRMIKPKVQEANFMMKVLNFRFFQISIKILALDFVKNEKNLFKKWAILLKNSYISKIRMKMLSKHSNPITKI